MNEGDRLWFKSYTEGIPYQLDYEEITMPDFLSKTIKNYPDSISMIFADTKITYSGFDLMCNSMSNALLALGLKTGDKVALLLPNLPQMLIAIYAIWRVGGIVVMNNPLYTDSELEHQLKDSGASILITLDLLAPRMIALKEKTSIKKIVVAHIRDHLTFPKKQLFPLLARDKHKNIPPAECVFEWLDLLDKYPSTPAGITIKMSDTACLQYTGGTTGVSKGVIVTHENLSKNAQQGSAQMPGYNPATETMMGDLPIFHAFGLYISNLTILNAWANVLIPKPDADVLIKAIHKNKVTIFPAVPTIFIGIINYPKRDKYDLTSLKLCVSGAAPCPVEVIKKFEEISGSQIIEGYGLSEASPSTMLNPVGGINKPGSVGLPIADTDVKIVNIEDRKTEVPTGEHGELVVKGPQVCLNGYYNMPEETKMTFVDGWLYTGDIAKIDEDGYIFLVDRKKDMIISGGYNIYPRDIDIVLNEHPDIVEACAKGVSDSYRGEVPKAFVVVEPGVELSEEDIINWCKEKLAGYKVPRIVEFMNELPKSAIGKVLKKEL
ncbi:MAG: long-chain fatty acid--CoA ligase [bacterium]|nr:long-chain fatty acid--CoA ligase [bacterium]